MKRVSVDLLPAPPQVLRWWLLTTALLGCTAVVGSDAYERYQFLKQEEARVALAGEQSRRAAHEAAIRQEQLAADLKRADALVAPWLRVASFDWDGLLLSIERLRLPGLRVGQLSVDAKQGQARLTIESADAQQVLEAVAQLNAGVPVVEQRWRLERLQARHVGQQVAAIVEAELVYRESEARH